MRGNLWFGRGDWIGPSKAGLAIGRNADFVRKLCESGELSSAHKTETGRWLVLYDDLEEYWEKRASQQKPQLPIGRVQAIGRREMIESKRCIAGSGIYALRYADGSWYVGQSTALDSRLRQHSYDGQMTSGWNVAFYVGLPADRLDNAEALAMAWFRREGMKLRNRVMPLAEKPRFEGSFFWTQRAIEAWGSQ